MHKNVVTTSFLGGTSALILALLVGFGVAISAPPSQSGFPEPTPTAFPADPSSYTIETVRGSTEAVTLPDIEQDGISLTNIQVIPNFPEELVLTATLDSTQPIEFIQLERLVRSIGVQGFSGLVQRIPVPETFPAELSFTLDNNQLAGLDLWTTFDFRITVVPQAPDGQTPLALVTELGTLTYGDPTQDWTLVRSNGVDLYFLAEPPDITFDQIGERLAATTSSTLARLADVFQLDAPDTTNTTLLTVAVYPDFGTYERISRGSGIPLVRGQIGFNGLLNAGPYVLNAPPLACSYLPPAEQQTPAFEVDFLIRNQVAETLAFGVLLQSGQLNGGGPDTWWVTGLTTWLSGNGAPYNEVVLQLAQSGIAFTSLAEGNPLFRYPRGLGLNDCDQVSGIIGASFINWLSARTGIETLAAIMTEVSNTPAGAVNAIETVIGDDFIALENAWRASVGIAPLTLADIDPEAALQPAPGALYVVGDTFVYTGFGVLSLNNDPGPLDFGGGGCFPNAEVEVLRVGQIEGVVWYEVECASLTGWVREVELLP